MKFTHLDAGESAFLLRELDFIRAQSFDIKFQALRSREFIPTNNSVNPGAQLYTYKQYENVGRAKLIANYADDAPRVDLLGREFTSKIKSIGASYGFSVQDIRAAQMAGLSLDARAAEAARRAVEQEIDEIARNGDAAAGLGEGFLNTSTVPVVSSTAGGPWESATPDAILADMNNLVNSIPQLTLNVEIPDTLLLPLSLWTLVTTTARSATSDTTILEYFMRNTPYITSVQSWLPLETAGAGGGFDRRTMAYRRDPNAVEMIEPQPYEQFPPQERNYSFVINCHARTGGTVWYLPKSAAYMDIADAP